MLVGMREEIAGPEPRFSPATEIPIRPEHVADVGKLGFFQFTDNLVWAFTVILVEKRFVVVRFDLRDSSLQEKKDHALGTCSMMRLAGFHRAVGKRV